MDALAVRFSDTIEFKTKLSLTKNEKENLSEVI
jgi:hypothetical protein